MESCTNGTDLAESHTPHPFDSHPPLASRIQNLGLDAPAILKTQNSLPAVSDSWFSAIEGAATMEAEQWKEFEDAFHKAHQENLAWRFKPEGDDEIKHVVKYFPEVQFTTAKGIVATLDYEKIFISDWESPVFFSTVVSCRLEEHLGRHRLVIAYTGGGKTQNRKVNHKDLKKEGADFLKTFEKYYGRHMTARKYLEQKNASAKVSI